MKAKARDPWWGKPVQLIVAASILFAFVQAFVRGRTDDPELAFLSFLNWCVLIGISIVPIAGIYLLIERAPPIQRLIGEGSDTRGWIVAGLTTAPFIVFWQVTWFSIVMPLETSAPWVGVLAWLAGSVLVTLIIQNAEQRGTRGVRRARRAPATKETARETARSGRLPIGGLLLVGLTLFVVTRMFLPPFQGWPAGGTGTAHDTLIMLGLAACLGWATLVLITVLPVIFVVLRLDRVWLGSVLARASQRTRDLTKLLLSLTLSIPAWFLAWDHLVAPFWSSAVGHLAGTMFSTLAIVLSVAGGICAASALPVLKQQSD